MFPRLHIHVLHTVLLFRPFRVVESVQPAHEVAGDPADALEADALPYGLFHGVTSGKGTAGNA